MPCAGRSGSRPPPRPSPPRPRPGSPARLGAVVTALRSGASGVLLRDLASLYQGETLPALRDSAIRGGLRYRDRSAALFPPSELARARHRPASRERRKDG